MKDDHLTQISGEGLWTTQQLRAGFIASPR